MQYKPNFKFIFQRNTKIFTGNKQVVCCWKHQSRLDSFWDLSEAYYGNEECFICEVNEPNES